jgi:hypothetical protein
MIMYRQILKQAWFTTWQHKYLWFFGLFAALIGNGGELEIVFRGSSGYERHPLEWWGEMINTGIFSWDSITNFAKLLVTDPATMLMIIFVFSLLAIIGGFLLWLVITSQAAIINNSAEDRFNKKHSLKEGVSVGIKRFWPVLWLNLLSKIITFALFIIISWPIFSSFFASKQFSYNLAYVLLFVVFIPISVVVAFMIKYSIAYTVIKSENFIVAIRKGFNMFKNNWVISIEMAFLLFAINFLAGLSLFILFLVLAVPFLFIILAFAKLTIYINFWFLMMSAAFLFIVVFAFAGAILSTFQISAWTNLFIELEGKGGISKITRLFERKK